MKIQKESDKIWGEYYSAEIEIAGQKHRAIGPTEEMAKIHLREMLKFKKISLDENLARTPG